MYLVNLLLALGDKWFYGKKTCIWHCCYYYMTQVCRIEILVNHCKLHKGGESDTCLFPLHTIRANESVSPAVFSLLYSSFLCFLCYKKSSFQWENEIHSTSWVLPWTLFLTLQVFLQCHHKYQQNTDRMDIEVRNACCFQGVSQASIWISELGLGIF